MKSKKKNPQKPVAEGYKEYPKNKRNEKKPKPRGQKKRRRKKKGQFQEGQRQ